jgi:hypothetical protein
VVVDLIAGGADVSDVATAAAAAAEASLATGAGNAALRHAFWLLTQIPLAARTSDFGAALNELGLDVRQDADLAEICSAMVDAVDVEARRGGSIDDFGEMATLAAAESLSGVAGRAGESLFGITYKADEARAALRGLSTEKQFGVLARDFFARLTRRSLDYFLSRELPNHVGFNKRFPSLDDHNKFERALDTHCREASVIMEEFAAGWFSKTNFETGINKTNAGRFAYVAFDKLRRELLIRRDAHG